MARMWSEVGDEIWGLMATCFCDDSVSPTEGLVNLSSFYVKGRTPNLHSDPILLSDVSSPLSILQLT